MPGTSWSAGYVWCSLVQSIVQSLSPSPLKINQSCNHCHLLHWKTINRAIIVTFSIENNQLSNHCHLLHWKQYTGVSYFGYSSRLSQERNPITAKNVRFLHKSTLWVGMNCTSFIMLLGLCKAPLDFNLLVNTQLSILKLPLHSHMYAYYLWKTKNYFYCLTYSINFTKHRYKVLSEATRKGNCHILCNIHSLLNEKHWSQSTCWEPSMPVLIIEVIFHHVPEDIRPWWESEAVQE